MRCIIGAVVLCAFLIPGALGTAAFAGDPVSDKPLNEHLEPLRPFLGKTWRGEFANSTPERPVIDVSRWERALNGNAIRILHSINKGEYGGETIVFYDNAKETLAYYYFTTAGFYTTGTFTIDGNALTGHEYVTGSTEGVTEVKSTGTIRPDGTMHSKAQYLKNGEWVDGHEVTYVEAPEAEVVFR